MQVRGLQPPYLSTILNIFRNCLLRCPKKYVLTQIVNFECFRMLDLSHNRLVKLENKTHGLLEDCLSLRHKRNQHQNCNTKILEKIQLKEAYAICML